MGKRKIAVLLGGQSSEHEISCISGATIVENINKDNYDVFIIGITKDGRWLRINNVEALKNGTWKNGKVTGIISPDAEHGGILWIEEGHVIIEKVDVIFPVLHGLYGEDGTVQGLIELSGIPYVGCGVLASSISMDKFYTKVIAEKLHILQAKYVGVIKDELEHMDEVVKRVEAAFPFPVFVKPSNAGSSKGISKAHNREELKQSLLLAAEHDRKILVEETIVGRELECAVLGGLEVRASGVGEILTATEFYDYDAKYHSNDSKAITSPDLPKEVMEKIRNIAIEIFKGVDGYSLSRVDFFFKEETGEIVFNEINTMPGFTDISMYPMLWEAKGISRLQLVERLIQSAFKRR